MLAFENVERHEGHVTCTAKAVRELLTRPEQALSPARIEACKAEPEAATWRRKRMTAPCSIRIEKKLSGIWANAKI